MAEYWGFKHATGLHYSGSIGTQSLLFHLLNGYRSILNAHNLQPVASYDLLEIWID